MSEEKLPIYVRIWTNMYVYGYIFAVPFSPMKKKKSLLWRRDASALYSIGKTKIMPSRSSTMIVKHLV